MRWQGCSTCPGPGKGYSCANTPWFCGGPTEQEERALEGRDPDCSCGFSALDPACVVCGWCVPLADGLVIA